MLDLEWIPAVLKSLANDISMDDIANVKRDQADDIRAIHQAIEAIQQLQSTKLQLKNIDSGIPRNNATPWTNIEKYILQKMCDENRSIKQMAFYFKRTKNEVKNEIIRQDVLLSN
jgi:hypothetical protein